MSLNYLFYEILPDVEPGPWGLCVVAAINKFTWTTEVLWRKRESMATLWVREMARSLPGQAFIVFLGILHGGWSSFTMHRFALGGYLLQKNKGEDVANYIREEGHLQMQREKWLNWLHSSLGGLAQILGSYFRDMQQTFAASIQGEGVLAKASLIAA